jgi:hypothetical protein
MTSNENPYTKKELRELQKRAVSALNKFEKKMKDEPSITLISNNAKNGIECKIDEIIEWLFKRRPEDGDKAN